MNDENTKCCKDFEDSACPCLDTETGERNCGPKDNDCCDTAKECCGPETSCCPS